ncbi:MAG: hypothetical protein MZW92_40630 [Comamonadaceae bacterium]|nr:hypothetical protein [Comamonadaceae bacterium]
MLTVRLRGPDRLRPHRARRRGDVSCASSSRRTPPTTSSAIREVNTGILAAPAAPPAALARPACATTTPRASTT